MSKIACKMCGGNLIFNEEKTLGTCEYCDSINTIPTVNDQRIINLFERANAYRLSNEFDRAAAIYESIISEDSTIAEAHWGLVLCKFGIEYVEDPQTSRRIPTCHRTQYQSIFSDIDYTTAIANADASARRIYESEAKEIERLQQAILDISKREKPFDVFICYKETDENKERTHDSVLAQELYSLFTKEGLKAFYAPITLESKLGSEYEPYIFAALNSAPVMVVVTTSAENVSSVWVKNEWSRYLALIKSGAEKTLIPCYRDMDPYDLPREFGNIQALDMSKLGFMHDLLRGVLKLLGKDNDNADSSRNAQQSNSRAEPLLKRAFMLCEDGNWEKADDLCEQVLNEDSENVRAYIVKLLCEFNAHNQDELGEARVVLDTSLHYAKVLRFGDDKVRAQYEEYNCLGYYNRATDKMNTAKYGGDYESAAASFTVPQLNGYRDSDELAEKCSTAGKNYYYQAAMQILQSAHTTDDYYNATEAFSEPFLSDYKDSAEKAQECASLGRRAFLDELHRRVMKGEDACNDVLAELKESPYSEEPEMIVGIRECEAKKSRLDRAKNAILDTEDFIVFLLRAVVRSFIPFFIVMILASFIDLPDKYMQTAPLIIFCLLCGSLWAGIPMSVKNSRAKKTQATAAEAQHDYKFSLLDLLSK